MQNLLAEYHRPDDTNLSASRVLDGVSENAASIPAITPPAIRRSDSGVRVIDPAAIAPPAQTSRRGFLMNTMVSAASLATAAAVVTPSIASAAPVLGDVSFPELVERFVVIHERWARHEAKSKAWSDKIDRLFFEATGVSPDGLLRADCRDPGQQELLDIHLQIMKENRSDDPVDDEGASIELSEICAELWPLADAMLSKTPRSIADLGWQTEALLTSDVNLRESLSGTNFDYPDLPRFFQNIRALAGPLSVPTTISADPASPAGGATSGSSRPAKSPDPIFALIDAHKAAVDAEREATDHLNAMEKSIPVDRQRGEIFGEVIEVSTDDPRWTAACHLYNDACDKTYELAIDMINQPPVSVEGVAALLSYAQEFVEAGNLWPEISTDEDGKCLAYSVCRAGWQPAISSWCRRRLITPISRPPPSMRTSSTTRSRPVWMRCKSPEKSPESQRVRLANLLKDRWNDRSRIPLWETRGRRFKSSRSDQYLAGKPDNQKEAG
jgi:hypothetical protein